jgi:hypothetical protein
VLSIKLFFFLTGNHQHELVYTLINQFLICMMTPGKDLSWNAIDFDERVLHFD